MSDIKRFNTEEEMLNYAKEKGNFDKEKKTATLSKKDVHNLVLNYLQAFLN